MNPPFDTSDDARALLESLPCVEGREPGFTCSPRYQVSRGNEILESYEGEHYNFVQAPPENWQTERSAQRLLINNRGYWITPDLLKNLTGKSLKVIEVMVGRGKEAGKVRKFLVATPQGNQQAK